VRIYFAGPLFTPYERAYIDDGAVLLRADGFEVCSPTSLPTSSTATAVSDALCTSTPITIIEMASYRWGATVERTGLNRGKLPGSCQVTPGDLGTAAAAQRWQVNPPGATCGNRVSRR
jgi:hypothetical protein